MVTGLLVLPTGFTVIGSTAATPVAAIADEERNFYGVQFHPEVAHTENGLKIIGNFVADICGSRGKLDNEEIH